MCHFRESPSTSMDPFQRLEGKLVHPDCHGLLHQVAIPTQEALMVADVVVSNFFCHFGVPRERYGDQGWSFKSQLLQKMLQCLGVCNTHTTHLQSDSVMERYVKTVEDHLRKVILMDQRDWDKTYGSSIHDTTGTMPNTLRLGGSHICPATSCSGLPQTRSMEQLHDIYHHACQHLNNLNLVAQKCLSYYFQSQARIL
jgi:hypothetical protein